MRNAWMVSVVFGCVMLGVVVKDARSRTLVVPELPGVCMHDDGVMVAAAGLAHVGRTVAARTPVPLCRDRSPLDVWDIPALGRVNQE